MYLSKSSIVLVDEFRNLIAPAHRFPFFNHRLEQIRNMAGLTANACFDAINNLTDAHIFTEKEERGILRKRNFYAKTDKYWETPLKKLFPQPADLKENNPEVIFYLLLKTFLELGRTRIWPLGLAGLSEEQDFYDIAENNQLRFGDEEDMREYILETEPMIVPYRNIRKDAAVRNRLQNINLFLQIDVNHYAEALLQDEFVQREIFSCIGLGDCAKDIDAIAVKIFNDNYSKIYKQMMRGYDNNDNNN
jgi:hypothetical protein